MSRYGTGIWIPGEHWVICDRCGFKYLRRETDLEWQGQLTCRQCWDPRHPQDILPPYRLDRQWVDEARPRPPDMFTTTASYDALDFTTFAENDPDSRITVAATQAAVAVFQSSRARLSVDNGHRDFYDDCSFRFTLQGRSTDTPPDSVSMPIALTLILEQGENIYSGAARGVGMYVTIGSTFVTPQLFESTGGNRVDIGTAENLAYDTDYYFELSRTGRTLALTRYDSGYAAVQATASDTVKQLDAYQYLIAPTLIYTGGGDTDASYELKDLSIRTTSINPVLPGDL